MMAICCRRGVAPTRKPVLRSWLVAPALLAATAMTPAMEMAPTRWSTPVQPMSRKIAVVPIRAAMVMPETGLALTPISPVMRDDTTTKKKPNTTIRMAPSRLTASWGSTVSSSASADRARQRHPDRQVEIGPEPRGRLAQAAAQVLEAGAERRDDRGQRPDQRDDAGRGHRARADVEHEVGAHLARAHVGDELGLGEDRLGEAAAEELDGGDEHQVGEAAAGEEVPGDPRPDDVADAQQLGRHLGGDRRALVRGRDPAGILLPRLEPRHQELVGERQPERLEQPPRLQAALLARPPAPRRRRCPRVGEAAVLLHDERAAQRDHHQDAHAPRPPPRPSPPCRRSGRSP